MKIDLLGTIDKQHRHHLKLHEKDDFSNTVRVQGDCAGLVQSDPILRYT